MQSGARQLPGGPADSYHQTMDQQAGATAGEQAAKTTRRRPADPITIPTKSCSCPTRSQPPARPTSLPLPATEANRQRMEEYLLNLYSSSSFNTCEHRTLPMMTSPPRSTPTQHPNLATIQYQYWYTGKKKSSGAWTETSPWGCPLGDPSNLMVICTKKNGSLRRTIDFQPLNAHATRETHHCPSPFHQARAVPHNTRKTILDAWNGYHSVPLREEDRHFTTFITPLGRYRYMTAPQGYIASGDAYTFRYNTLVAHIDQKTKCVDDILLWSEGLPPNNRMAGRNGIPPSSGLHRAPSTLLDL